MHAACFVLLFGGAPGIGVSGDNDQAMEMPGVRPGMHRTEVEKTLKSRGFLYYYYGPSLGSVYKYSAKGITVTYDSAGEVVRVVKDKPIPRTPPEVPASLPKALEEKPNPVVVGGSKPKLSSPGQKP